nr:hypothetical protein [uncultured Rhodopila sp.]
MSHAVLAAVQATPGHSPSVDHSISAVDAALLLFNASPAHANNFALSRHERAAWGYDTTLIEYWADVVTELSRLGRTLRFAC